MAERPHAISVRARARHQRPSEVIPETRNPGVEVTKLVKVADVLTAAIVALVIAGAVTLSVVWCVARINTALGIFP